MKRRTRARRLRSAGVTLMELLIAVTLVGMLAAGIVIALRVGLSAMNKADAKLTANRRVASVERILNDEISAVMPVTADCHQSDDAIRAHIPFFQGEAQSMRLASAYSLQQGSRGLPMILEFKVIPGENNQGVRLVVNEHWYTGAWGAGSFCTGIGPDPETGGPAPVFVPIEVEPASFVLADKLSYCRFSYRDVVLPGRQARWLTHLAQTILPSAIRVEMAPLVPDPAHLQPVTVTVPTHVTRVTLGHYDN